MSDFILSKADRAYFRTMMRRQINSAVHRRMNSLLLLDGGWSVSQVAEALFWMKERCVRIVAFTRRKAVMGLSALNMPGANLF